MELPLQIYQDLKDALPALEEALKTGVSYGDDLAHRFIMYDIAVNLLPIVLSSIFLSISVCATLYANKRAIFDEYGHPENLKSVLFIAFCLTSLISGIVLIISAWIAPSVILKDIYIPEVRIIEVVGEILQSNQ